MKSLLTNLVFVLCFSQLVLSQWYFEGGFTTRQQAGLYIANPQSGMVGYPGARQQMAGVFAEGELWLYGGFGVTQRSNQIGYAGDLWTFNPTTNFWAFEAGSAEIHTVGKYGVLGAASTEYVPGGRRNLDLFYNSNRNLIYLFGGQGRAEQDEVGELNEMWTYNILTKEWAWISGQSIPYAPAVVGEQGDCAPDLVPGGRYGYSSGYDADCEKFYIFGGWGVDSNGATGFLSDVWAYDVTTNRWGHLGGQTVRYRQGTYPAGGVGTFGPSANGRTVEPGSRRYAVGFLDAYRGHFYIGFGQGLPQWTLGSITTADFWRFDVVSKEFQWVSGVSTQYFLGDSGNPRARFTAQNWYDESSNTFYMYGGISHTEDGNTLLGDIWQFDVEAQVWSQTDFGPNDRSSVNVDCGGPGCTGAIPGARFLQNAGAVDSDTQTAYMYGGYGPDVERRSGYNSEFWSYSLNPARMISATGYECAAVTDSCYLDPTAAPSMSPTAAPFAAPTSAPSVVPTNTPTRTPVPEPSSAPSTAPSGMPSGVPSSAPSVVPTAYPSVSPTVSPSAYPSMSPSRSPYAEPSVSPSGSPSEAPTQSPYAEPSVSPSGSPTVSPTSSPFASPSEAPTGAPTVSPCGPFQRAVTIVAGTQFGVCQNYFSLTRVYADQAVEVASGPLFDNLPKSVCMPCGTYVVQVFHSCDVLYQGWYSVYMEGMPVAFDAQFAHTSARVLRVGGCDVELDPYGCDYGKQPVKVAFAADGYPQDIRFSVFSAEYGQSVLYGGYEGGQTCVEPGYYAFQVVDWKADGICCSFGQGAYFLAAGSEIVNSRAGDYGVQDAFGFKVMESYYSYAPPTGPYPYPMGYEIHEDAPQELKDFVKTLK